VSLNVAIIGTGYVGLTTGACFAELGHSVVGVDIDPDRVARLSRGDPVIHEDGLKRLLGDNLAVGRLRFTTSVVEAVTGADIVMIAVGTPRHRDGHVDLNFVEQAADDIAPHLTGFTAICVKSTVPAGTNRRVGKLVSRRNPGADFALLSNPEFLREGRAVEEFMNPERIVLGVEDPRALEIGRALYRPLTERGRPLVTTSIESAEVAKYAANTFLAARLALINEFADVCEQVGGDIEDVIRVLGVDSRIGPHFLRPGPGFGGSCFPKDVGAVSFLCEGLGDAGGLIRTILPSNQRRQQRLARRVLETCGIEPARLKIAALGLTFKADTDDVRDSPALAVIGHLKQAGARISAYDPAGMANARSIVRGVDLAEDAYVAAKDTDAVVVLTEWEAFRALDFERLREAMRGSDVFDFRNVLDRQAVENAGFRLHRVGAIRAAAGDDDAAEVQAPRSEVGRAPVTGS